MIDEKIYEDGIIKAKKSRKLKKRFIMLVISLLVIAFAIVGFFLMNRVYKEVNTLKYDYYNLYQYFAGIRYDYTGIITIKHNNNITNIKSNEIDINVDNTPIYFQDKDNEVLFPQSLGLFFLNIKNKNYRVNYFSKIMVDITDNKERAFLVLDDSNKYLDTCFLYDGDDLYFFPYATEVIIDDVKYELSPLSYIIVQYNGTIEMYNKGTDEYLVIDDYQKDVIANIDDYKINLSTDMVLYDNDNRLLIKRIDKLNLYE